MLLAIEARIGELLPSPVKALKTASMGGSRQKRPEGITEKRAHGARAIARNPKEVEEIKRQARENENIPIKTAVLNRIACEKEKQRQENADNNRKGKNTIDRISK